jgi:large subunit ribosomal protein L1
MPIALEELKKAVEEALRAAKPRRFKQSVDLVINFKDLSLKQPEAKINEAIQLPHVPEARRARVCVIAEGDLAVRAKGVADAVIGREELERVKGDRRLARRLAKSYDFFVAQADLMSIIGRTLGPVLGPRGKMPTPLPSTADPAPLVRRLQSSVRVRIKDLPLVQCSIGVEDMPIEHLAENAKALMEGVEERLKAPHKLGRAYVKLTMGPPVEVGEG